MHLVVACNSSGLRMQLHLNFRWFWSLLQLWCDLKWMTFTFWFVQICYYVYIYVSFRTNMLIYTQYRTYIWFCTNRLLNNLSSKPQFSFICLKQTMMPFISKKHILFISKPIWMIFVALDALGGGLQQKKKVLEIME
jgi:hypothetical protein